MYTVMYLIFVVVIFGHNFKHILMQSYYLNIFRSRKDYDTSFISSTDPSSAAWWPIHPGINQPNN